MANNSFLDARVFTIFIRRNSRIAAIHSAHPSKLWRAPELSKIRDLIGAYAPNSTSQLPQSTHHQPGKLHVFGWQAPTMILGKEVLLFRFGPMILIYNAASSSGVWGANVKIAVWFTIPLAFATLCYLASWDCTKKWLQELSVESNEWLLYAQYYSSVEGPEETNDEDQP